MGKKRIELKPGDIFEFQLPNGKFAYGREYRDAAVGFYKFISDKPDKPPIGLREFFFICSFQTDYVERGFYKIVGFDPFANEEESWGPPAYIYDELLQGYRIYEKTQFRRATKEECEGLETTQIQGFEQVIPRIMKMAGFDMAPYEKVFSKQMSELRERANGQKGPGEPTFFVVLYGTKGSTNLPDRFELEDKLNEELEKTGWGEVSGGGEGGDVINIDIQLHNSSFLNQP